MRTSLLLLSIAGIAFAAAPSIAASYVVHSGKSRRVVVLPDDATAGENYAAKELCDYIRQISGVELRQIRESELTQSSGPYVAIGRTKLSRKYVTDSRLAKFGDDGYTIFTSDGNAFFVGGRKRGSLYAVYDFLESLGVRWYSPGYTVIPKLSDVPMPSRAVEYIPKFWYRDQWWNNGATNEWLARMRINGSNGQDHELPEEMGGSVATLLGCHSYHLLVPPDECFAKHPEWYALKPDGKRSPGELCLTNPELRDFVAQRVLKDLRASSKPIDAYWVSQNDGAGPGCYCERCTAERAAHGGKEAWSANTIGFVSYVADKIKPEFPKVRIKTLAYNYTTKAPENMTASDNVLVEICGNFVAEDDEHGKLVHAWSKVAKNISVYTYGGSNYGYWWPYPNVEQVGRQCPLALRNGVTAFYIQGAALGYGSGLVELRAYLTARLAWDPARDVKTEMRDFCDGFYGPGGKFIYEYETWYADYAREHKFNVDSGWGDSEVWRKWVTKEAMDHGDALFQRALEATKNNAVYHKHVRQAYLEVLWGSIMINTAPNTDLMNKDLPLVPGANAEAIAAKAKLYGEIMRENGYDQIHEGVLYDPDKYPH